MLLSESNNDPRCCLQLAGFGQNDLRVCDTQKSDHKILQFEAPEIS